MYSSRIDPAVKTYKRRFLIKVDHSYLSIACEAIAYFESHKKAVNLVTLKGKKYEIGYNLEQLQNLLDPSVFFRVNRSHLISYTSFVKLIMLNGKKRVLELAPDPSQTIPIASARLTALKMWLDS